MFNSTEAGGVMVNDARSQILAIRDQAFLMGANDSEKASFEAIIAKMESKEISEEAALESAHQILSSKQDYH